MTTVKALAWAPLMSACARWGLGDDFGQAMLTNYREAVTAKFPKETKVKVWFPLRLSNFLPGHSTPQQNILFHHRQADNTQGL